MVTKEIQGDIEKIENDTSLIPELNFVSRMQALDYLEFNIIDRIDGLVHSNIPAIELTSLRQRAETLKNKLESIDETLFQKLRAGIRAGRLIGTAFKDLVAEYVGHEPYGSRQQDEPGYDSLDMFIDGLLLSQAIPNPIKDREAEMVYYQQTPARIIFELIEKAHLTEKDIFYDLGSGLGQVPILVNITSGALAKGVEFEPAYYTYASACALNLNLAQVEFINEDARTVDLSDGNVFFMYTPFEGGILQVVLEKLKGCSQGKKIRLFTYGTCTFQAARQNWLECVDKGVVQIYKLAEFKSR